jgi:hypothetical protein
MAGWTKREYSKGKIDRYGALLVPWWNGGPKPTELGVGYLAIQNWRSSHAMPLLTFRIHLTQRAERVDPNAIIAQRLKRFASIMNKLSREPHMKLSQMQDLGGCRAIMSNISALQQLYEVYREANDDFVQSSGGMKCSNYLQHPKRDGYRGIHLVGRYHARAPRNEPWNGHRIEIQLRTQLQHAFATAVETVTTFTKTPLKFGGGPDDWRRFFSLMGSSLAIREGTPLVEGTPTNQSELIKELRELTKTLKVRMRLRGWTKALRQLPKRAMHDAKWILLVLDVSGDTIQATGFIDGKTAMKEVAKIEMSSPATGLDAVLVGVNSIKKLRSAYPNYYADTAAFVEALNIALQPSKTNGG